MSVPKSPILLTCPVVHGPNLVFETATGNDAQFILDLRLDSEKGRYLSTTDPDINRQKQWIEQASTDPDQNYFVISNHSGIRFGTVRLYGPRKNAFCWGSWILDKKRPRSAAVESTLMVYMYALFCNFRESYFDVRRDNSKVWQYHERMGARRVGETHKDYLYEIGYTEILSMLDQYGDRVAGSILVQPSPGQPMVTVSVSELLTKATDGALP